MQTGVTSTKIALKILSKLQKTRGFFRHWNFINVADMNPVQCMRARLRSFVPRPARAVLSHTVVISRTASPSLPLWVCHECTFQSGRSDL